MPKNVDLGYALKLAPKDAIAYFESKGYAITFNWWELWQEQHARAFTVSKAATVDILEDIRAEISRALREGTTEREFTKALTPRLQARGWWGKRIAVDSSGGAEVEQLGSPWRLKTIYRTNMQTSYMAARWKFSKENADARPYWQYVAVMDSRTRPEHAALNGLVFRHDDPFWATHTPPLGFNCRCRFRALSKFRMEKEGLTAGSSEGRLVTKEIEAGIDKRTGESIPATVTGLRTTGRDGQPITVWTDPGWNYNKGEAAFGLDVEIMRKISLVADQELRTQAVQTLNNSALRQDAFSAWALATMAAGDRAGHAAQTLGLMDDRVAMFVRAHGAEPSRVLVMNEKTAMHARSPKHVKDGIALTAEELTNLPRLFGDPATQVYWDHKHDNLLYAWPRGDETILLPVEPDYRLKKYPVRLDALVNAYKIRDTRLQTDTSRFERLE